MPSQRKEVLWHQNDRPRYQVDEEQSSTIRQAIHKLLSSNLHLTLLYYVFIESLQIVTASTGKSLSTLS